METCFYRLTSNADPEERLEEAAMWKALRDEFGESIEALDDGINMDGYVYGRPKRNQLVKEIEYWNDPAFLAESHREFSVHDISGVAEAVAGLHSKGKGAFIKSTRSKHWICKVPVGVSLADEMGGMEFSFIDGGPRLMVQELVTMRYEWRFFVIGRQIVADSPNAGHLTPIDYPCNTPYATPAELNPVTFQNAAKIRYRLKQVAERIALAMRAEDAVIDCAEIGGIPGCVELNPMIIGGVGLFACDVRALAKATRKAHPRLALKCGPTAPKHAGKSSKWRDADPQSPHIEG